MTLSPNRGRAVRVSKGARGFTLVEIMVSMMLFMIVVLGAFATMITLSRAQAATARLDVAQSGVRAALELITRDVEMASAGARSGTILVANGAASQVLALQVSNKSNAADRLDLTLIDATAQATLMASFSSGMTALAVDSSTGFKVGDTVQLSDLTTAVLLQVTSVSSTTSIGVSTPTNAFATVFAAGSYVFRSRSVSYFVDTTSPQDPLLMFDPDGPTGPQAAQPIVEGIEDMQVALGFDFNGDGILTSVGATAGDDDWVFNVAGESAPASLAQLKAVRVTLVARTTSPVVSGTSGIYGQRPTAEDRPGASGLDAFPRRVLRSEISVRNFNL